jgi:hypothetical protein
MSQVERRPVYILVLGFALLLFGLAEIILLAEERPCSGGAGCPVAPGYEVALFSPGVALAGLFVGIALIATGVVLHRRVTRSRHSA